METNQCPKCADNLICPKCQSVEAIGAKIVESEREELYEVLVWAGKRVYSVADDDGLELFSTLEQAETVAEHVAKDRQRSNEVTRICIYRATPFKEVPLAQ